MATKVDCPRGGLSQQRTKKYDPEAMCRWQARILQPDLANPQLCPSCGLRKAKC